MEEVANVVGLIRTFIDAAETAQSLREDCLEFPEYLQLITSHLEKLQDKALSDGTIKTLTKLEDTLERSYELVHGFHRQNYVSRMINHSYLRNTMRRAQDDIDKYLRLIPLTLHVSTHRDDPSLTSENSRLIVYRMLETTVIMSIRMSKKLIAVLRSITQKMNNTVMKSCFPNRNMNRLPSCSHLTFGSAVGEQQYQNRTRKSIQKDGRH
ncbi:cell number regulator 13-like [Musa acuminata AAA Group]|uniref:cell number regulator 13-like n=1 Tax=Musa acuminata AAA Group TaxID=214697 RepID=UPI0031DC965A